MTTRSSIFLSLPLMLCAGLACAQHAPQGRWITASGNLEVQIAPCGAALCGSVTKVLGNRSMSRDGQEMQPADTRPALGMQLLSDFTPIDTTEGRAPTEWRGSIYNRENGKHYRCTMSLSGQGAAELVLRPYIGIPLFGQTQIWHRAAPEPGAAASAASAADASR